MNNYLDLALQATPLPFEGEPRLAGAPRLSATVADSRPVGVKAGFMHAPIDRPEDITGRWRPVWSEQGADVGA